MAFTLKEPYYGVLLSSMNKEADPFITPTLAVAQVGNVFKLFYNPGYLNKLTDDQALEVIKHEILHLAFGHFTLFDDEDPMYDREIKNIALDMEVNGYVNWDTVKDLDWCSPLDFGWDWHLGGREYLKRLRQVRQQQRQQAQAQQPTQPCNGGQGGQGQPMPQQPQQQPQNSNQNQDPNQQSQNGQNQSSSQGAQGQQPQTNSIPKDNNGNTPDNFDDHSKWPTPNDSQKALLDQVIEDMLVFAADEVEKNRGVIPGEIAGKVTSLRNKKFRPVADWKRFFRRYLGNEFTELIRKSKKRESRRFPDAAGNRHRRKSHILVAIDTSGSLSMPEYHEFFGQIKTLTRSADFHVIECDSRIQHEYDYKMRPNETLHGGGGTDFQPPIDVYNQNKRKYDALVYFTDGEAPIPHDTPKDCLWVISSKGDQSDKKRYQVNGAKAVFIPNHN